MGSVEHNPVNFGVLGTGVVEGRNQYLALRQKVGQLSIFYKEDGVSGDLPEGIGAWVHLRKKLDILV